MFNIADRPHDNRALWPLPPPRRPSAVQSREEHMVWLLLVLARWIAHYSVVYHYCLPAYRAQPNQLTIKPTERRKPTFNEFIAFFRASIERKTRGRGLIVTIIMVLHSATDRRREVVGGGRSSLYNTYVQRCCTSQRAISHFEGL